MGIFQKVTGWLADKSDQFVRGGGSEGGYYYATKEARQAYSGMGAEQEMAESDEAGGQTDRKPVLDPFGHGEGDYGGRVPYKSKYEKDMEAYQQQMQQMQQSAASQNPAPNMQPPVQGSQPPMQQQEAPQRPMQQQPVPRQAAAQAAYPQGYGAPANNVVPFPGMQRGPDGLVYAHVEYVVLLRSRLECKDVIGYIKTSASVFLNMEFIASDSERQRCVDMLSGAAFTLGCALNKISPRGIYLISSPAVKVVLDPAIRKFSASQESQGFVRQRYDQESYRGYQAQPAQEQQGYENQGYTQAAAAGEQQNTYANAVGYDQQSYQPAVGGLSQESPTARFQAQGTQRTRPVSFSSAVSGGHTYSPEYQ